MHTDSLRLLASAALGMGLMAAGAGAAHAQQPPAGGAPIPPEAQPAEPATPAVEMAPLAPPAPEKKKNSPISVEYDKGIKFESEDGDFEAKLSLRTQFRFELTKPTDEQGGTGTTGVGKADYTERFFIPRGRLQLEGHVWGKNTIYKLEFSLADKVGFAFTKDLWVEQIFGKVGLRVGQFKGPFNRQELVSDFASEFNERAITAKFVEGGRDIGVMINNGYADKAPEGLEWSLGLMNSFAGGKDEVIVDCPIKMGATQPACGLPAGSVKDWDPAVFARVGWNQGKGLKGYSEGDLEGGPLRFGVGLSYKVGLGQLTQGKADSLGDVMKHGLGVDAMVKVEGLDVMVGAFMIKKLTADATYGFHLQAGYFITPKKFQVAARFAQVDNTKRDDDTLKDLEIRGAINYYFHGHAWKWATDFGIVQTTGKTEKDVDLNDDPNIEIRSMAQLTF